VLLGTVMLIYLGITLFYHFEGFLLRPWCITDDARMHMPPFIAQNHPEHFTDRFLADYAYAYLPPGYRALMSTVCRWADPLAALKGLGLGLLLATWLLSFTTGRALAGTIGGWLALFLAAHSDFVETITLSGLFRGFGPPLVLLFLYSLIRKNHALSLTALLLMALFYPPVFLCSWPVHALLLCIQHRTRLLRQKRLLTGWLLTSVAAAALLLSFTSKPADWGSVVTLEQAEAMPEWQAPYGRFHALPLQDPSLEIGNALRGGFRSNKYGMAVARPLEIRNRMAGDPAFWILATAGILAILFYRPFPGWWVALAGSGIAWYFLARASAFALGWPDRFINYSLPFLALLTLPMLWKVLSDRRPSFRWLILVPLLVILGLYPLGFGSLKGRTMTSRDIRRVLKHLKTMDRPMLIAAWPNGPADDIPVFGHKEVMVNYENAHPLYTGHYALTSERIRDCLRLLLASDPIKAKEIADRYGVTHVVVRDRLFMEKKNTPNVFAPFNDLASQLRWAQPLDQLLFANPPTEAIAYRGRKSTLIDLQKFWSFSDALVTTVPDETGSP
jgi:hypothetical protein